MSQDEQIDSIIMASINIIETEVNKLRDKQEDDELSKQDTDKVVDFLKTLVLIQKDKRQGAKEEDLEVKGLNSNELDLALEKAIQEEIDKRNGNA